MAVANARILDRFEILEVVGRGSFGRVLRVADRAGEYRALKLVAPGPHEAMLLDEFEQLAKLRHPSLPRVFEVGRTTEIIDDIPAGAPFFLAEWIGGTRSDSIVSSADAPIDPTTIWSFLADVAGALATIHAAGLVHADVAPQNLLVDSTRTVLVDLGLASAELSARGTPAYMAPEAFANRIDARSDLYGLGACAIRLVTNRPPFEAASLGELVQRIVTGAPPRALPGLPAPLADLIRRLVEREPDARPPSALAVLEELDQLAPAISSSLARRARPKVGAPPAGATWSGAHIVVDAITKQLSGDLVVVLVGPPSAGGRTIADSAIQRWQLARVARTRANARILAGSIDDIATTLGTSASPADRSPTHWLERIARRSRRSDPSDTADLILVDASDDPRGSDLATALSRSPGDRPVVILVEKAPPPRAGLAIHATPLLDVDGISHLASKMLGSTPPSSWSHGLVAASGGLPLTAIELIRSTADEKDPFKVDWSARSSAGAAELRAKQLKALSASPRRLVAALASWGGRARLDRVLAGLRVDSKTPVLLADATELERAGLARRRGDDLAIDRATIDAIDTLAGADSIAGHAAAALSLVAIWIAESARDSRPRSADVPEASRPRGRAATQTEPSTDLDLDEVRPRGRSGASQPIDGTDRHRFLAASASWLAPLLERAPLDKQRAELACDVADHLLARGRADRALVLAKRAIAVEPARANLIATRAASFTGAYKDAASFARAAQTAGAAPIEAQLALARAAQRGADLATAETTLAALHAAHPEHAEVAGAYARLLVTRSRYADARAVANGECIANDARNTNDARNASDPRNANDTRSNTADRHEPHHTHRVTPLAGLRAEAAGLAAFYLGDLDEADSAFAALEVGATAAGDSATMGRALSLRGMVAQQRGQLGLASDRYREAARRLDEVGELHAAAVAELNLGTVLSERGRASEALPRLAAAGRVFAELGATTELCAAELNRGNALLAVGQLDEGRRAAETALARSEGAPHLRAFALLVLGDARARLGDAGGAVRSYREALGIANERGDAHAQISAYVALAEAGHHDADAIDVYALCASADDRDRWTIARGKLALHEGDGRSSSSHRALGRDGRTSAMLRAIDDGRASGANTALDSTARRRDDGASGRPDDSRATGSHRALHDHDDPWLDLAHACADVGERAAAADRLERAFRAHALASALAQRARDIELANAQADRARTNHATLVAAAAPAFRAALDADPDLARLPGVPRAAAPTARADHAHLRRLLTLSRRLNSEASVERILDDVIDTAIELTDAERGFLLLRQVDGELAAVVSRNFTSGDLGTGGASVSRSIAERAAQTGEPVMTVDAGIDERFGMAASVAALRLRSVLAVPLRQRGAIIGCIYVDHRLRGGAFDDGAASMLGELADIAAIAIENARLSTDLRATTTAVAELNARLSAELADKDAELVRVKADLPDRDRLRHRYDKIVGRSPAMLRMLEIVDRAAATSLPVVIVGESGTGKELVARALHDNGPRKDGAFVAINCSAVPEPLLESELFGHVRGAFTGADRDRRGLFEVADGGTLFLDEIADTSVAMQAKLLRVLQDGVIRRVGDTATQKVDVRIVTASQRSLADLAATGRFREDLRFRLEVIQVPVPALRDRDGDVPLLVESLLVRLASNHAPKLTRAAMRALGQHRWPGNVRELENALARGVAMGGDVIDVGDLPEAIAHAAARPEPAKPAVGEDLRLKPALSSTEQAYITAAMARAKGNQTVAARLLGLSRFGLQKKLRRLAGDDVDEDED